MSMIRVRLTVPITFDWGNSGAYLPAGAITVMPYDEAQPLYAAGLIECLGSTAFDLLPERTVTND